MLYITTRSNDITFTSHRALVENQAPDGGYYAPFYLPVYSPEEIAALKHRSFSQIVADILNTFFSARLTGWDVDFCIGRNAVRLMSISHRIVIAELWHNTDAKFSGTISALYAKICGTENGSVPTDWASTAIRIAVMFGIYGRMLQSDLLEAGECFDLSVPVDDYQTPISVFYARQMGLPIDVIVSASEDNGVVWDMIHRGAINTKGVNERLKAGLEKLVYATLGCSYVEKFSQACEKGSIFALTEEELPVLNKGLFCTVAGHNRASDTINSLFRSNAYIVDPVTALCYAGSQDYRAKTGDNHVTLLLAERTPMDFAGKISQATGVSAMSLVEHIKI